MKYDITQKQTRGAKRTLDAFSNEMFSLLSKKTFEDIAVNEICDQTNYPRATFYNYFDDKYDLLNYCWLCLAGMIRLDEYDCLNPDDTLYIYFDRVYDFTEANRVIIQKILQNNLEIGYMFSSFRTFMNTQIRKIFKDCSSTAHYKIPWEIVADHYSNTLMLIWQWCFEKDLSCSKEDAHEYLRYLVGKL